MQLKAGKLFFIIILLFLLPLLPYAQSQQALLMDSLQKQLMVAPEDSNKVKLLNDLSYNYFNMEPDKGILFGNQGLALAKKINWQYGIAAAYTSLGANYWGLRNFLKAQQYYLMALGISEALGNKPGIAKSLQNIATITQFPKCLIYFERAVKIYESIGDKIRAEGAIQNMGMQYESHGNLLNALQYYQQGLALAYQINNDKNIANVLLLISRVYTNLKEYNKALENGKTSLEYAKKLNDKPFFLSCINNTGNILLYQKKYKEALVYYEEVLKKFTPKDHRLSKEIIGECALNAGEIYLEYAKQANNSASKNSNLQKAVHLFNQSLDIFHSEFLWSPVNNKKPFRYLAEAYELQGNYKHALKASKKYAALSDSIYVSEKTKILSDNLLEYENARQKDSLHYLDKVEKLKALSYKQEKEQNKSNLKRYWINFYTLFIGLSITGLFIYLRLRFRQATLKNELAKERAEKLLKETAYKNKMNEISFAALRSQMNPHFIFNCLNSIRLYIEENNSVAAADYLTKFSKLIRNILDNAAEEKTNLASEIDSLKIYLEMESMRFMEKLHFSIAIDNNIDADFIEIPPMLIQPFVENSIWHGLMNKKEGGVIQININLSSDKALLLVTVSDNGVGRKKAAALKNGLLTQQKSYGTKLTNERLALMNEKSEAKGSVQLEDILDDAKEVCGTLVTIQIPLK